MNETTIVPKEKASILIVDDREDKLLAIESCLEELDENIVRARSGAEALRILLRQEFAVILLDVSMPVMDGFETASLIRQRKNLEKTPIIFVTSVNTNDTHVTRGYSLGAVDYIFAPVVPEVLRAKVSAFADLFRKNRDNQRQGEWLLAEAQRRATVFETRLRGVLDRLNVGVFRCAPDGKIVEMNPAFRRLIGLRAWDPAVAIYLQDFLPATESPAPAALPEQLKSLERDIQLRRCDGGRTWVSLSWMDSVDDAGEFIDGLVEDISERKSVEEALMRKAQELARSNDNLEQFAYLASHDLKEPLRGISSFSSLLASHYRGKLDANADEYIDFIVSSAKRMHALINDLLAFARIRRSETNFESANCAELLDQALFSLNAAIEESGATVRHDSLPTIKCDKTLIRQLFQNLISNALKFRGVEKPLIHVSARATADSWEFSVHDNGIGIAPEYQEQIFGIFKRLHRSEQYPGTGMGLAFCRKIVQIHGGSIWVTSEKGKGSTFHFQLPSVLDYQAQPLAGPLSAEASNGQSGAHGQPEADFHDDARALP